MNDGAARPRKAGPSMAGPRKVGPHRGVAMSVIGLVLGWIGFACWNVAKPMPPGTHVSSLSARLADSQVAFLDDFFQSDSTLRHEIAAVDRAERLIVLNQCPLARDLAEHLLLRMRRRPNLKLVLVTDPRNEVYGGTPAHYLTTLEASGIIVVRTALGRLRDSHPWYSSGWRATIGWWSDPFDEVPGRVTLNSTLRRWNDKANERQLLVADDGSGGWTSILSSQAPQAADGPTFNVGLEIRGRLARDMIASELQIAAWSTDDDRLPEAPPVESRGVGTIDARFLTEGATLAALRDTVAGAGHGDAIDLTVRALGNRQIVDALARAAARGARLEILLDPAVGWNRLAADELSRRGGGRIEIRWQTGDAQRRSEFALIQHRDDVWLNLGSADFSRRSLDDLDLEANVELRMQARDGVVRAAVAAFERQWSSANRQTPALDESRMAYWEYRLAEWVGLG